MEITSSQLYWLTRLDSIEVVFSVVLALSAVVTLIAGFFAAIDPDDDTKRASVNVIKVFVPTLVLGLLGVVFVPNTEEAAAIWIVPKVANSPQAAGLGTNAVNMVNMGLKYLSEKAFTENK